MGTTSAADTFATTAEGLAGGLVETVSSLGVVGIGVAAAFVGYRLVRKIFNKL